MLESLLAAYQRGDTHVQQEILDELEPLLHGLVRSIGSRLPPEEAEEARCGLVLAFHLRAEAGRVRMSGRNALRAEAHRLVLTRLADPNPIRLLPLADPETGSMVFRCLGLGLTLESILEPTETQLLADRLAGEPLPATDRTRWQSMIPRLQTAGILRS